MSRRFFFQLVVSAVLGKCCPKAWRPSIAEIIRQRMEQAYLKMQAELTRSLYCDGRSNCTLYGLQEAIEFTPRPYMGISRANYSL